MAKYSIKKGEHSSGLAIGFMSKDIRFNAVLDSSCLYSVEDWDVNDKKDINKLYGFTNGLTENDSARFGWRCKDGVCFEITTYVHNGGPFVPGSEIVLGIVKPGEEFKCRLRNIGKSYIFNFNNGPDVRVCKNGNPAWISLMLKFYFGGNHTAPQDMFATIN
jgi:hypothetical protein